MNNKEALALLNNKAKLPLEVTELQQRWKGTYYGMSLHTMGAVPKFQDLRTGKWIIPANYMGEPWQELFDKYYFSRHTREDIETRYWRYSQYRPLTKAPFSQITEIISGAIFQDSNYHLEIPEEKDNAYIWGNNFYGYDLIGYFANIGIKNMMEDPNGLFVRMPKYPYYEQTDEKVEVEVLFVNSPDIVYYDEKQLLFKKGNYAFLIDTEVIYRYTKTKTGYVLAPEDANGYYAHMFGYIPATIAGGEWNTKGFYESYYSKAKGVADDFISTYSAAQMVDKEASHPFIEKTPEECPSCNGQRQIQSQCSCDPDADYCNICNNTRIVLANCGTCHGTGTISVYPGRWREVPQEDFKDGSIRIINPDVSINKHHRETVKQLMIQLKEALHLYNTDKSESGEAKAIDQERRYQFIMSVTNNLFDKIIYDTVRDIIKYRNVTASGGRFAPYSYEFKLVKPTQFKIKTSEDLMEEYKEASTSNLPVFVRKKISYDYVDKAYNGDMVMRKKMELVNEIDTAGAYPVSEWLALRAAGAISNEDMIINRMLPTWLDEILRDRGQVSFLNITADEVRAYIQTKLPELQRPVTNIDDGQA